MCVLTCVKARCWHHISSVALRLFECFLFFLSFSVCIVSVQVHTSVHMCAWGAQSTHCVFCHSPPELFWDGVSNWAWSLLFWLGWLPRDPPRIQLSLFPNVGAADIRMAVPCFMCLLLSQLGFLTTEPFYQSHMLDFCKTNKQKHVFEEFFFTKKRKFWVLVGRWFGQD